MKEIRLKELRGLGGKLGDSVAAFYRASQGGVIAADTSKEIYAADLQVFDLNALVAHFGEKFGRWIFHACRGQDDEPVKPTTKPKSLLAFKSFSAVHSKPELEKWFRLLCSDLVARMAIDRQEHSRRPTVLMIQHRGQSSVVSPKKVRAQDRFKHNNPIEHYSIQRYSYCLIVAECRSNSYALTCSTI
jgi:hypothetical protein